MPSLIDKHGNVDYFGKLSWSNVVDWMVTFCLGGIIIFTTMLFGTVRPETQLLILPLFTVLLILHGVWFLVEKETPKRISPLPVLFVPFVVLVGLSAGYISPTPWLGWLEWIGIAEIFIFLWILINNVRTRAHLWVLMVLAVSPIIYATFIGFYQFFQNPNKMARTLTDYGVRLNENFLGQATGSFGDPNSFAVFLLVLMPCFFVAGIVPRLPRVLRVLSLYIGVMLVLGLFLTQLVWPLVGLLGVILIIPWFSFRKMKTRVIFTVLGSLSVVLVSVLLFLFSAPYKRSFESVQGEKGEMVRLVLWEEALRIFFDNPVLGSGAGSFQQQFEQSPDRAWAQIPLTPHNDYLLVLSNYGLLGGVLLFLPVGYACLKGYRIWGKEHFTVKLKIKKGRIMPPQKFFLSIGISGVLIFSFCAGVSFILHVPSLPLYGVLFFAILVKSTFSRRLILPSHVLFRFVYFGSMVALAIVFYQFANPKIASHGKQLQASGQLTQILVERVHLSGNSQQLDDAIILFEEAVALDPSNCDAWLGLSTATCQLYFRDPSEFTQVAERAVSQAQAAKDVTEEYWRVWAQLGIAQALGGDESSAGNSLRRALDLAPNSSNANFYWASYLATLPDQRDAAILAVQRALEINPDNRAAKRLQQKLFIL